MLLRIFENRNIKDCAHLTYPLSALEKPDSLKDGEVAAGILADGIRKDKNILIVGDYDTDGATASALGLLCLPLMGARHVDYLVPNRFDYGYGLSKEIATVALSRNPDIVITVDNGISSVEGVDVLKNAGVDVVITDHHLPGLELPGADAILNPNQPGCMFPSKVISGVGVIVLFVAFVKGAPEH